MVAKYASPVTMKGRDRNQPSRAGAEKSRRNVVPMLRSESAGRCRIGRKRLSVRTVPVNGGDTLVVFV
jgi:hypothetical protein